MKKILFLNLFLGLLFYCTHPVAAKVINMGEFKLTAYCPCEECSEGYGRKCAMQGKTACSEHTIAVDTSVINLGTKVKIGGKTYTAEDVGSAIKGDHIDIFFDTHTEVEEFGIQYKDVKIIQGKG